MVSITNQVQPVANFDPERIFDTIWEFLPEVMLIGFIVLLIILSLTKANQRLVFIATIISLIVLVAISYGFYLSHQAIGVALGTVYDVPSAVGVLPSFIKVIICVATLLTVIISGKQHRVEYFILLLSALLGGLLLLSSDNLVMILLSIELISISSYVLTAGTIPDKQRAEAAWKFFIYGSVATATMIFGMTYIYGAHGNLLEYGRKGGDGVLYNIGEIMFLGGFLFKMTAAPFHLWAPDVYEAAPTPVVAFLSVVPKLAGFSVVFSFMGASTDIVAAFAILSIIIGTLAALNQTNAKRMMAYSSVAQAGFLLTIVASLGPQNPGTWGTAIFYALVFAIMNFVVFIVINEQEKSGAKTDFPDFAGIGYTNPIAAISITAGLISLTGIPPVAGFMAKLLVFTGIWTHYTNTGQVIVLTIFIVGLLATVASLFFYLKIPFYMFFRRPEVSGLARRPGGALKISPLTNLLLAILVGLLVALFIAPGLVDGLR